MDRAIPDHQGQDRNSQAGDGPVIISPPVPYKLTGVFVKMVCQKCAAPLNMHTFLDDISQADYDLLTRPGPDRLAEDTPLRKIYPDERQQLYDEVSKNAKGPVFRRIIPPPSRGPGQPFNKAGPLSAAMSFVMLSESQLQPNTTIAKGANSEGLSDQSEQSKQLSIISEDEQQSLSYNMERNIRLFEIMTAQTDIDHPVCEDCVELLLSKMKDRLAAAIKERDAYTAFLKELKNNAPTEEEVAQAEVDAEAAEQVYQEKLAVLIEQEKELAELVARSVELEAEERELELEEQEFWKAQNAIEERVSRVRTAEAAMNASYEHDLKVLERLRRTNVYNDCFCIGHDGNFGTINNLRMGRLAPPNNVEWEEINAAWGTTAFLLATVASKLNFTFSGYEINPRGSTSLILRKEHATAAPSASTSSTGSSSQPPSTTASTHTPSSPTIKTTALELFSSGDLPLGRTILHRRFNDAMVAFLACLRQLGEFVEHNTDSQRVAVAGQIEIKLPYVIEGARIGGLSIKLGSATDEQWTTSCKYVLTCCKFLLAHASNEAGRGARDGAGGSGA